MEDKYHPENRFYSAAMYRKLEDTDRATFDTSFDGYVEDNCWRPADLSE